jgi:hypothetical protein
VIDAIVMSMDEPVAGEQLARRTFLSRFHFDRLVAGDRGCDRRWLRLGRGVQPRVQATSIPVSIYKAGDDAAA